MILESLLAKKISLVGQSSGLHGWGGSRGIWWPVDLHIITQYTAPITLQPLRAWHQHLPRHHHYQYKYSCPSLVKWYTEELISRTFLVENRFRFPLKLACWLKNLLLLFVWICYRAVSSNKYLWSPRQEILQPTRQFQWETTCWQQAGFKQKVIVRQKPSSPWHSLSSSGPGTLLRIEFYPETSEK